jgi:GTP cyclohydrolase I
MQGTQKTPRRFNDSWIRWANELNRQFSKEVQMANKYMKKCSTFLVINEMQIKKTLKFHLILVRLAISNVDKNWGRCRGR